MAEKISGTNGSAVWNEKLDDVNHKYSVQDEDDGWIRSAKVNLY